MPWPYHLIDLTDPQKTLRRQTLDRYGVYAQLSPLILVLPFLLYRFTRWSIKRFSGEARGKYDVLPGSPQRKAGRGGVGKVGGVGRRVSWWLDGKFGGDVGGKWGLGERKFWLLGGLWGVWLGGLCVRDTGDGMFSFPFLLSLRSLLMSSLGAFSSWI